MKQYIIFILYPIYYLYKKQQYYYAKRHPKLWANRIYQKVFGHSINWENPRNLNEKVRWLQFNTDTSRWSYLSDKYKVRDYIKEKQLNDILIPLYGRWDNAEDINFDNLPQSFVLKTNHGCGEVIIVKDKSQIKIEEIRKKIRNYLHTPFGVLTAEPHYLKIPPCIIAEKLLIDNNSTSSSLIDYKFYCFYGKPQYVLVCYDRKGLHAEKIVYDMDWQQRLDYTNILPNANIKDIPKPKTFEQMKNICKQLGKDFPFVRIDLYEVNEKLYFGEFTFTPASGISTALTPQCNKILGDLIDINNLSSTTINVSIPK